MAEEKKIEQPSVDLQELLDSVLHDEPTEFVFRGKKHKLGWLRKGTMSPTVCYPESNYLKKPYSTVSQLSSLTHSVSVTRVSIYLSFMVAEPVL